MLADLPYPLLLLLHEGGWDEIIMVAVGLGVAYLVIMWTGRGSQDEDEDESLDDQEVASDSVHADPEPGAAGPSVDDSQGRRP